MTVGKRADDVEGIVEVSDRGSSLEQDAQSLDENGRPLGEVGDGVFSDPAVLSISIEAIVPCLNPQLNPRVTSHGCPPPEQRSRDEFSWWRHVNVLN